MTHAMGSESLGTVSNMPMALPDMLVFHLTIGLQFEGELTDSSLSFPNQGQPRIAA